MPSSIRRSRAPYPPLADVRSKYTLWPTLALSLACSSSSSGDIGYPTTDITELPVSMQVEYDEAPRLLNGPEVRDVIRNEYRIWLAEDERTRQLAGRQVLPWRGLVVMHLRILATGNTSEVRVVRATGRLEVDRAAARAASAMRWQPATRDGVPVDIWFVHQIRF